MAVSQTEQATGFLDKTQQRPRMNGLGEENGQPFRRYEDRKHRERDHDSLQGQ